MTRVLLLPEAEEELRAAAQFYETEQEGLGRALIREARRTCRWIAEHPLASRVERKDIRVRSIAKFPYRIYYRADSDQILVIAVGHRRRRPDYWRQRE
jgi:plasmid stabilization system protein ParE